ncbi:MAG: UDP-2,3-diacylglucosamine diphosphatase, partial [Pseudomonadota bacterium]|nr:UDP-2,3-diacylglucosamine diphosphatase [Pseudomonadota bacterium]
SWVGDDDPNEHYAWIKQALRKLTRRGVPVFFMHGNRDFMIGEAFAEETGVTVIEDPSIIEIYGNSVLLSHGDAYCTDDVEYQGMREMSRDPEWQAMMLGKSLEERLLFAAQARATSKASSSSINEDITDVNTDAIDEALRAAGVYIMVHGHTHRPAVHDFVVDGQPARRIVLGDWYDQGSVIRWDKNGPVLASMSRE